MRILPFIIIIISAIILKAQSPHEKSLQLDCSACHQSDSWQVVSDKIEFDHNKTEFILTGQHRNVSCIGCHTNLRFSGTPKDCLNCHKDVHQNSTGSNCSRCHSTGSWIVNNINQLHQESRFPLTGAHLIADCQNCHHEYNYLKFEPLGIKCYDCHSQDYYSAQSPNHYAGGISTTCEDCHSINSYEWSAGNFEHTFFPLTGGHNLKNCSACHTTGSYSGLSSECYSCHQDDYENVKDPNHITANFSNDCRSCHNINSWDDADFDHSLTGFPLTDSHMKVSCSGCHQDGYDGTNSACNSCHNDNYMAAMNPDHKSAAIPTDCQNCHTIISWVPSNFNHSSTSFILEGSHANIQCSSCHKGSITGLNKECFGCHNDSYTAAQNPDHKTAAIPNECSQCHTQTAWIPSTFDHTATGFKLEGQHTIIQCSSCHKGSISGLNSNCYGCHTVDYAEGPNHISQSYPLNCEMCHTAVSWQQTNFNHQNTRFPLTGAHITAECVGCHTTGFTGTTTNCFDCHNSDYNGSTNPNHTVLQLSNDCIYCHTTNPDWTPAAFPIHNNFYQLLGAHLIIQNDCISCHNGNYISTPNTCIGCHTDKYNSTTNPNHQAAGFPSACESCHNQISWSPANWDHDGQYFPIYSGNHKDKWDLCSDCHTNISNYSVFSCFKCHSQADMNEDHNEVSGYSYNSDACFSCHPNGSGFITKIREKNNVR